MGMSTYGNLPVVLDSFCEPVYEGPLVELGVIILSVLALLSQYSELDLKKTNMKYGYLINSSLLHQNRW